MPIKRHRLTASTARHRIAMGLQDPDRLAWVPGEPACSGISGICSNQAGKRWTLLLPRPQQPRAHKTRWCCTHRELKTVAKTGREKYRPLETGASSKRRRGISKQSTQKQKYAGTLNRGRKQFIRFCLVRVTSEARLNSVMPEWCPARLLDG